MLELKTVDFVFIFIYFSFSFHLFSYFELENKG